MTICIDINFTSDTSTLDLVFPNGIEKGGRVRLNLLRPKTGNAGRDVGTPQAPNGATVDAHEAKRNALKRPRASLGHARYGASSKRPAERRFVTSPRNEREDSDSEAVDALPDLDGAYSCPSSPSTASSQEQEWRPGGCGTAAKDSPLGVRTKNPSPSQSRVPVPASANGQVQTDCPNTAVAVPTARMSASTATHSLAPVAPSNPTPVLQTTDPAQTKATPTYTSWALGKTVTVALPKLAVIPPPQNMPIRHVKLPRASLVSVVLPETITEAKKLPPDVREAFIAALAKTVYRCLECSHATLDKAMALAHLAEHAASQEMSPAEPLYSKPQQSIDFPVPENMLNRRGSKTQQSTDHSIRDISLEPPNSKIQQSTQHPVPETLSEPPSSIPQVSIGVPALDPLVGSPLKTSKVKKPTKRAQCQPRSRQQESADTSEPPLDQEQHLKKCEKKAPPKKRAKKGTASQSLECDECHRTYSSRSNLRTHQTTVHSTLTYACDLCSFVSHSRRSRMKHIMTIHQQMEPPSECEQCKRRFTTKRKLQHHVAVMHMGDGACLVDGQNPFPSLTVYRCKQCSYATFSQYRNKAHAITHTGVMPFQCSQCDKAFVLHDELNRHILMKHNKGKLKECPHCKRRFMSDSRYNSHLWLHEKNAGFVCEQCGQLFESKAFLGHHMQRHLPAEEPCPCDVCGMVFKNLRAKTIHTSSMHPEVSSSHSRAILRSISYPHGCDECPMRFKTPSELHSHKFCSHTPGNSLAGASKDRFRCSYCHRCFRFSFSLRMHLFTHTGERPFACQYCDKAFNMQSILKNHIMAMHTKDFKLHCLLCGRGCVNNTKLKQHLRKTHKAVEKSSLPVLLRNKGQRKSRVEKASPRDDHQQLQVFQEVHETPPVAYFEEQGFVEEQEVVIATETALVVEDPLKLLASCF